jgi:hypothetical protein
VINKTQEAEASNVCKNETNPLVKDISAKIEQKTEDLILLLEFNDRKLKLKKPGCRNNNVIINCIQGILNDIAHA